jgi:hypothetical protein
MTVSTTEQMIRSMMQKEMRDIHQHLDQNQHELMSLAHGNMSPRERHEHEHRMHEMRCGRPRRIEENHMYYTGKY